MEALSSSSLTTVMRWGGQGTTQKEGQGDSQITKSGSSVETQTEITKPSKTRSRNMERRELTCVSVYRAARHKWDTWMSSE